MSFHGIRGRAGDGRWSYQRFFAWFLDAVGPRHDRAVADRKRTLFRDLPGRLLEIGPGTGINFGYYPSGSRVIGVEPNPFLFPYLDDAARDAGVELFGVRGRAEALPLPDASVELVVSTVVLCSVEDPATAVREIYRVLAPGGRLVFVEHVAAAPGSWLRRLQGWVRPLWRRLGDGCHPDRETAGILASLPFDPLEVERFQADLPVVSPHVAGTAVKP